MPHRPEPAGRPRVAWRRAVLPLALAAALAALAGFDAPPGRLPPVVFVSRAPVPGSPHAIPGLGPAHRAAVTGGRLLVREPDGRLRSLLPEGALIDACDPAVSFDGRTVAFAGIAHPDSGWRIHRVGIDGSGFAAVTGPPAAAGGDAAARADDLDPCWIGDSLLCFASTRGGRRSQYADVAVTNLWCVRLDGAGLVRLTAERNGAEEPLFDPARGSLIYSRWWYNAHRAAPAPAGVTTDPARALPGAPPNLWQAIELGPGRGELRLAAGEIRTRRGTMAYQPALLADGTMVAVFAHATALWPAPGPTGIQSFPGRYGRARRLAGAVPAAATTDPYFEARGLAAPAACAPAGLPDGRVLMAFDPGARGDFGIWCMRADGGASFPIVDLPGSLELDPAPVVQRPLPRRRPALPVRGDGFDFECRNVFATGPSDGPVPEAPPLAAGYRLRFFESVPRPGAGDTAILVREVAVGPAGEILAAALPAHVPMFEQLVDAGGNPVITTTGPAHVAGLNFGAPGARVRCVGCHLGHSTLPADAPDPRTFNAAPSARARASSRSARGGGPGAAIDRRIAGPLEQVAWVAAGADTGWLRLDWDVPLALEEVVLIPPRADRPRGIDLAVTRGEVRWFHRGSEIGRRRFDRPLAPRGTRFATGGAIVDGLLVRILATRGTLAGERVAALAEIETLARLAH